MIIGQALSHRLLVASLAGALHVFPSRSFLVCRFVAIAGPRRVADGSSGVIVIVVVVVYGVVFAWSLRGEVCDSRVG